MEHKLYIMICTSIVFYLTMYVQIMEFTFESSNTPKYAFGVEKYHLKCQK